MPGGGIDAFRGEIERADSEPSRDGRAVTEILAVDQCIRRLLVEHCDNKWLVAELGRYETIEAALRELVGNRRTHHSEPLRPGGRFARRVSEEACRGWRGGHAPPRQCRRHGRGNDRLWRNAVGWCRRLACESKQAERLHHLTRPMPGGDRAVRLQSVSPLPTVRQFPAIAAAPSHATPRPSAAAARHRPRQRDAACSTQS